MTETPTRKEIYTTMATLFVMAVTSAFALDEYRDNQRADQTTNLLAQLDDRLGAVGNRITVLDGNLTDLTSAIIVALPHVKDDADDDAG